MSLRTVALETPSDRVWAIDWDATGCAVWTYSSTIARSTAARRSVASMLGSPGGPVGQVVSSRFPPVAASSRIDRGALAVDSTDCYRGRAERVTGRGPQSH